MASSTFCCRDHGTLTLVSFRKRTDETRRRAWSRVLLPAVGLAVLPWIMAAASGHGMILWIQDTTRPSNLGGSGAYGSIPTYRCHYLAGTRLFRLNTSTGFGAEPCSIFRRTPDFPPIAVVDEQAVLPEGAAPRDRYVRRYSLREVTIGDDTPFFTSQGEFGFLGPRRVWVAVYALPGTPAETGRPGLIVLAEAEEMPMIFHGGCHVVNLVADPDDGRTLASWCNVDDRLTPDGAPRPVPHFIRP